MTSPTPYTPLFHAQHDSRYQRQSLIKQYEDEYDCNLVVMIDQVAPHSVTLLNECLDSVDPQKPLHLMLRSPGGDPETAIRLIRMCHGASSEFSVVVPEQAKSAATIMSLGADRIFMGPTSDLGPIDPQVVVPGRGYVSAKDLIAAYDSALEMVAKSPSTAALHAGLLGGIDATTVQFARSALERTGDIARQAIVSNDNFTPEKVDSLCEGIQGPLIDSPKMHGAVVGAREAEQAGLTIEKLGMHAEQWKLIQKIWTRYFVLGPVQMLQAYEGARASQVSHYKEA